VSAVLARDVPLGSLMTLRLQQTTKPDPLRQLVCRRFMADGANHKPQSPTPFSVSRRRDRSESWRAVCRPDHCGRCQPQTTKPDFSQSLTLFSVFSSSSNFLSSLRNKIAASIDTLKR